MKNNSRELELCHELIYKEKFYFKNRNRRKCIFRSGGRKSYFAEIITAVMVGMHQWHQKKWHALFLIDIICFLHYLARQEFKENLFFKLTVIDKSWITHPKIFPKCQFSGPRLLENLSKRISSSFSEICLCHDSKFV